MGNELPKSVKDQIIADAKMRTGFDENKDHKPYDKGMYHGFVSAACIYTDKAQVLVDALESLKSLGWQNWQAQDIAEKALHQFKDGKGKEAECPKCNKIVKEGWACEECSTKV